MITFHEAISLLKTGVKTLPPSSVALDAAVDCILAEDIFSENNIPAFNQSSMDGYAFRYADWEKNLKLKIDGEAAAGIAGGLKLNHGQAIRIFTGASIPQGADTVVMQENSRAENGELIIMDKKLAVGHNVRIAGMEIKAGEKALGKNTRLTPAAIGFLAGIGVKDVKVYSSPAVSLIITGNELQLPGEKLLPGQVYESNSFSLRAVLKQLDIAGVNLYRVKDDPEELKKTLKKAMEHSDVVLFTGGVSVGDYDYVLQTVQSCGIKTIFHKVKQKPGKPLYFGKNDKTLVFGLPGNPASVLTSFYVYVAPALDILAGKEESVKVTKAVLASDYHKNPELTFFLKGAMDGQNVMPMNAQESFRMRSFASAKCLIQLDEGQADFTTGNVVEVHLLPD